jgi:hypothetical protein
MHDNAIEEGKFDRAAEYKQKIERLKYEDQNNKQLPD